MESRICEKEFLNLEETEIGTERIFPKTNMTELQKREKELLGLEDDARKYGEIE